MKHIQNFFNFGDFLKENENLGVWVPKTIEPEMLSPENVGHFADMLIKMGPVKGMIQLKKIKNIAKKFPHEFDPYMDGFGTVLNLMLDKFPELGDESGEIFIAIKEVTDKMDVEERIRNLKSAIMSTKDQYEGLMDLVHAMEMELKDLEVEGKQAIGRSDMASGIGGSQRRHYSNPAYNRKR